MPRTAYAAVAKFFRRCPPHILALLLLFFLLVLPCAFINTYFTLDVGGILAQTAMFPKTLHAMLSPFNGSGRYYPVYWFYQVLLYNLFHLDLTGHYIIQTILFLFAAALLTKPIAQMTGPGTVTLFGVSVLLSSANAETLYTIGKAEPLLFLFFSILLLLFYYGRSFSPARFGATALMFLLGLWSKETAIVLFPFCVAGIVIGHLVSRHEGFGAVGRSARTRYTQLMFSVGFGWAISRIPYFIFANDGGSGARTYLTYRITPHLIGQNMLFYLTQQPDVVGFGILATVFVALLFNRVMRAEAGTVTERTVTFLILAASVVAMSWSYMGILFVFRWPMAYYPFIPSILFRFVTAYGLFALCRTESCRTRFLRTCRILIGAFLVYGSVYLWYTVSSQAAYSQVYTRCLREYLKLTHKDDLLVFESFPFYSEQVGNTTALFHTVFGEERRVHGIADVVNPAVVTPEMMSLLNVSAEALRANEANIPRKDDYVVAMTGDKLATWQIRGIAPWYCDGAVLQRDGSYEMRLVSEYRIYWPGLFVNVWTHRPDAMRSYVGYKMYRVLSDPRFVWFGKYPDGWIGKQARLTLYPQYVGSALVHVSTSHFNPHNSIALYRDGVELEKVALSEGKEHTFDLSVSPGSTPTVFRFEVERTFVPKDLGLNDDKRELGVFVRLEPVAAEAEQDGSPHGGAARLRGRRW
jgi:hypothetical protein